VKLLGESILILEVFFCIEMHARPYENKLAIPSHPTSNMPGMYSSLLFD
jgi:hypothetical protein